MLPLFLVFRDKAKIFLEAHASRQKEGFRVVDQSPTIERGEPALPDKVLQWLSIVLDDIESRLVHVYFQRPRICGEIDLGLFLIQQEQLRLAINCHCDRYRPSLLGSPPSQKEPLLFKH